MDGVVMGSPLGPVRANTFMVELKSVLVSKLNNHAKKWRHFVDDTFVYVKYSLIEYVLTVLNLFQDNIKFTYEQENNDELSFLYIRDHEKMNTAFFRKDTHSDLYFHWESFSPISWKRGTLKSLISKAYMIFFNQCLLEKKLEHF